VSISPDEIYAAPRSWVEQAYPNLIHYNPELFVSEVRTGLRSLR
jgi:hypothetical protein